MCDPKDKVKDNVVSTDILLDAMLHKATLKLTGSLMSLAPRVPPIILTTGCRMLLTKSLLYAEESTSIRIPWFFQALLN